MKARNKNISVETQLAVLTERVDTLAEKQQIDMDAFNKRQEAHHENVKKIGNDIGLLRIDVQGWSTQTQQVVSDHKDMKKVIDNNTAAFLEMREMVQKILTEKATTKSNIIGLGKLITWIVALPSALYYAIQAIGNWIKNY